MWNILLLSFFVVSFYRLQWMSNCRVRFYHLLGILVEPCKLRELGETLSVYTFLYSSVRTNSDYSLQHQTSSIERKIKKLRETKKQQGGCMICHIFQSTTEDIEMYEEELQEICRTIRLVQCENILKQKVLLL